MSINYTGQRRPRGDDPAQWELFFAIDPDRGIKFPEQFSKYVTKPQLPKKKRKIKVEQDEEKPPPPPKLTKEEKIVNAKMDELSSLIGRAFWSTTLQAIVIVRELDPRNKSIKLQITKTAIQDIEDLNLLHLISLDDLNYEKDAYAKMNMDKKETLYVAAWRTYIEPLEDWGKIDGISGKEIVI